MIHLECLMNCHLRDIEILKIGLFEKLNDYIIFGLKNENDLINTNLDDLKNCIKN